MQDVSVDQALECILAAFAPLEAVLLPLDAALGCVLASDVVALHDLPPFANSGMDGFAVRVADLAAASRERPVELRLAGAVAAGAASLPAVLPGSAVRIMTGAPLPEGTEAVVPLEDVTVEGQRVSFCAPTSPQRHLRPAGEDVAAGALAIAAGQRLRPQEIGMLAALGYTEVAVVRRPRIAIISTGDELVAASEPLRPGTIRDANSPALAAFVATQGGVALSLGIARDSAAALRAKIAQAQQQQADLIVTSAGASAGDFDIVHSLLAAEGQLMVWRVNMKPGRPLLFGRVGATPLLGLPGNPASALIVAEIFLRPALRKLQGRRDLAAASVYARLAEPQRGNLRRQFVRARLERQGQEWLAVTAGIGAGSAALSTLVRSNALLVIPEDSPDLPAGTLVEALVLDAP